MDTAPRSAERADAYLDEAREQRRLALEIDSQTLELAERRRLRTLQALRDVDAGRLIDDEAMRVWADGLGTDRELPAPHPG